MRILLALAASAGLACATPALASHSVEFVQAAHETQDVTGPGQTIVYKGKRSGVETQGSIVVCPPNCS
ncbi:MAG TPA: hypothetical protein VFZ16_13955 [Hyphomicrobiaceae bacterium]|nr:hypothetical protein [Hyphomicrobiaceae bacterium]